MTRALLERCLTVLESDPFGKSGNLIDTIRAELAKPEQQERKPAWHDTPTCPGLWLCTEGERDPRDWVCWPVEYPEKLVGVEDQR